MSGSYTQTPNLGLFKPTPNSDTGTWGYHLNSNADTLDTMLNTGAGGVFLPVSYTATGGTVSRAAQDRAADNLNVRDFYSGNWDTAFDAAFTALPSSGGTIIVPPGTYNWAVPHVWANKPVTLVGAGKGVSNISIAHTSVGLTINQTGTNAIFNRTTISGLSFFPGASAGPTQGAIAINYPSGANFPAAWGYVTFTASHIEMVTNTGTTAPTWPNSFLTGITLTGVWQPHLNDIHFFGVPSTPGLAGSYAIGLAQCEDTRIHQLYAQYGQAGVMILDHGEGLDLASSSIVGTDWGISVSPSATNWASPSYLLWNLIQWTSGECATYLGGMNLRNMQDVMVSDTHFSRFGDSGASGWTAINLTDCNNCIISNNRVDAGVDAATATYVSLSYVSWACFGNQISNALSDSLIGTKLKTSGSANLTTLNYVAWLDSNSAWHYETPPKPFGVTNASMAPAGVIGEIIQAANQAGSPLTTGTAINVTSIVLTAGDWDVRGEVWYYPSATMAYIQAGIGTTSATVPNLPAYGTSTSQLGGSITSTSALPVGSCVINVSASTTVYLLSMAIFASGTVSSSGKITARRMR